jgi:capsid protein
LIGRRYCGATVVLSDGSKRDLWYLIESRMGFVAANQNVEFCVSGFDRWFVYNGRCRVLR